MKKFSYERVALLHKIAILLADSNNLSFRLKRALDLIIDSGEFETGTIFLADQNRQQLTAAIFDSKSAENINENVFYKEGEGICGKVLQSATAEIIPSLADDKRFLNRTGIRGSKDLAKLAYFCLPIIHSDKVIGVLSIDKLNRKSGDLNDDSDFLNQVAQLIAPFVQFSRLADTVEAYSHAKQPGGAFTKLVGKSTAIEEVKKLAARVADTNTTVLITGETGTGKGVVAGIIHQLSSRRRCPLVEVNCGAIPENLIESELFGHEKGAFTGAISKRVGVLERAGAGTVFLDEIGELPISLQTRLLRVLQTKEFERVGGSKTLKLKARVICATNLDLEKEVKKDTFRSDLYFRISVFPIHMPQLSHRGKADVMLLTDLFIQRFAKEMNVDICRLDTPAIDMLTAYHWPGNVRELENVIERAVLLADGGVIHGNHLPPSLQMNIYQDNKEELGDFYSQVQALELVLLTEALKDCGGKQSKAAKVLGITQRIMQYKVIKYNIDYKKFR